MNNKDRLITELSAEYGIKKEDNNNNRFQYSADTNSLYRKSMIAKPGSDNFMVLEKPEATTFDVPLEKDEYTSIVNESKRMLVILDKGVKVGNTIKVYEHEALKPTSRFILKEVTEVIHGEDNGPVKSGFCVVLLK